MWHAVTDLQTYTPSRDTVYINTLPHQSCNVISAGNDTERYRTRTAQSAAALHGRSPCAVYCAHEKCNAAKRFMKNHRSALLAHCSSIDYLVPGAKSMLEDDRFELADADECAFKLSLGPTSR